MNLIKISENTLINPDMISSVEIQAVRGGKQLVVTIDGKQKIVEIEPDELLKELTKAGVSSNQLLQFWAG